MSSTTGIKLMLGLFSAVVMFHFCIILKVVPYEITWGGRLKNDAEMYVFEAISLAVNFFLIWMLLMKGGHIKKIMPLKIINAILWLFLALFVLNTIGNVVAKTAFEKSFALLTLASSILIWIILTRSREPQHGD